MTTVHRSKGSIERKLQSISGGVLDVLGAQWISGYKPLAHYQDSLVPAERTPFWLMKREVDVAEERSDRCRVRRLFRNHAQMFEIVPP
ncbi:hypothetical protein CIT37_13815 [Bradyrhizobium ottawaense]|uniref:hypothetical protein n=1 Tax=Bradyrhizobium ottawaense TaxID=931866 RepID=UPI0026809A64